ncbi:hypothetical protein Y032_1140g3679 [Ancylostoma ceylanicum]|uniref:Uncharacterized protein n=1 Tax=Ancylostoma ceylanicum TaxID=53326 RepID=A0A016W6C8_9BILA|nr:hypothetical protein Y032_1140g3679 [Ancylostoma ceylanicum]
MKVPPASAATVSILHCTDASNVHSLYFGVSDSCTAWCATWLPAGGVPAADYDKHNKTHPIRLPASIISRRSAGWPLERRQQGAASRAMRCGYRTPRNIQTVRI